MTFVQQLLQCIAQKDPINFTKIIKTIGYKNIYNRDFSRAFYPVLRKFMEYDWAVGTGHASRISELIWSMGRLGFKATVPEQAGLAMELLHRLTDNKSLSCREVTTALGGLARMNMKWMYLHEGTRTDIRTAIGAVALRLNDREIGNILHSMTKLMVPWHEFPNMTQNHLLESFVRNSIDQKMVSHQGSMAIYSLGLLGIKLDAVTPAARDNIFSTSINVLEESYTAKTKQVTQQSSNVIYGLMKMGAEWNELPSPVKECIIKGFESVGESMNEQEVANTIYSLGGMEAKFSELPESMGGIIESTAIRAFPRMIPQGGSMHYLYISPYIYIYITCCVY